MSRRIGDEASKRIAEIMFRGFSDSEAEVFLRKELGRYVPKFKKDYEKDILAFIERQRGVYLEGKIPEIGLPIASLSQYPAGFHSWYCDSFKFNNCFAEPVRHDKSTTTDYGIIIGIARENTVK